MLIICLLVCGCTGEKPASSETKNPAFETPDIPVNTSPSAVLIPATLSDRHLGTTIFTVPGVIVVSFQAKDPQDMHIALHSRTSSRCSALSAISMTGPYNGSVAFRIPRQDEFNLNITGSENWTVDFSSLTAESPQKVPLNFSGSGTTVTTVFYLEKGQYILKRNVTGKAALWSFLDYGNGTTLMDQKNSYVQPGFGANTSDTFRTISIPESGNYFLQVFSDRSPNPWFVYLDKLAEIPLT